MMLIVRVKRVFENNLRLWLKRIILRDCSRTIVVTYDVHVCYYCTLIIFLGEGL